MSILFHPAGYSWRFLRARSLGHLQLGQIKDSESESRRARSTCRQGQIASHYVQYSHGAWWFDHHARCSGTWSKRLCHRALSKRARAARFPCRHHRRRSLAHHSDSITNVVDVYINYLRRKIDSGSDRSLIRTVQGVGYRSGRKASGFRPGI